MEVSEPYYSIIVAILGAFLGNFVFPFLKKWATDLAAYLGAAKIKREQEEVAHEYAQKLEEIKSQNSKVLEQLKNHNSLRLAAADKRLEVSAKANEYLTHLLHNFSDQEHPVIATRLEKYIIKNGVYFGRKVYVALHDATLAARIRDKLLENFEKGKLTREKYVEEQEKMRSHIMTARNLLFESVDLPPMNSSEYGLTEASLGEL